jgi:hypothetical protein
VLESEQKTTEATKIELEIERMEETLAVAAQKRTSAVDLISRRNRERNFEIEIKRKEQEAGSSSVTDPFSRRKTQPLNIVFTAANELQTPATTAESTQSVPEPTAVSPARDQAEPPQIGTMDLGLPDEEFAALAATPVTVRSASVGEHTSASRPSTSSGSRISLQEYKRRRGLMENAE